MSSEYSKRITDDRDRITFVPMISTKKADNRRKNINIPLEDGKESGEGKYIKLR
jgi:hypothetical protein